MENIERFEEVEILDIARNPVYVLEIGTQVPAGFPSPASEHDGEKVDLNSILLPHPDHTYLARVRGTSMEGGPANIQDGALLAVDCALEPQHGQVVVAALDGEFTVKRLERRGEIWWLVADNPHYQPIDTSRSDKFEVWGVVTHVVTELINGKLHQHCRGRQLR